MSVPLLIISDAPTAGTGLARITKDLATRIAEHMPEVFRVATIGYGGSYTRSLPFPQYNWVPNKDWIVYELPEIWKDFAGDEKGIVMTIWDASRLLWFSRPENCADRALQKFLQNRSFKTWGYFPIDATGPNDRLTAVLGHIIDGYDRVLAYSKWAADILHRTLPARTDIESLPHGIDTSVFTPRPRVQARHSFGARIHAFKPDGRMLSIADDAFMIGIVATNQARKDYGLGIQVAAEIAKKIPVTLWIHTDTLERHWSIPALLNDFNFLNNTVITCVPLTDEQMSWCYSACDVTLGIGLGEGFGYPIFESLACGTPCIHGDSGGAAEHMNEHLRVGTVRNENSCARPIYRLEGVYNCCRPVFDAEEWASRIDCVMDDEMKISLPPHLDWNNLWPRWEEWLSKGIHGSRNCVHCRVPEHSHDVVTTHPFTPVPGGWKTTSPEHMGSHIKRED